MKEQIKSHFQTWTYSIINFPLLTSLIDDPTRLPIFSTPNPIEEPEESPVVIIQVVNQPVHIPRTLWERLIARFGTSSIAVSKDHGSSEDQQRRRATDVDFRQPTEKEREQKREKHRGRIDLSKKFDRWKSREENVLGEDGSAEELEQAGSSFA